MLDNIKRLNNKAQNGPLSLDEQRELDHNEKVLAQTRVKNLEKEQQVIRSLPTPRELDPVKTKALADAKAVLARPAPGGSSSSTHSSGGGQPLGNTATSHGGIPPAGHVTGTYSVDGGTEGSTGTHTTNGVTPSPFGHGKLLPETTTSPEHIDLARRRAENLGKVAAVRRLNPHEQAVYDNARRILDRTNPGQSGDRTSALPQGTRNTGNPQDLVLAGGGPDNQTQGTAAEGSPPTVAAQPPNAIGATIQGPGTANPDALTASAGASTSPFLTGPAGTSPAASAVPVGSPVLPPPTGPARATTGTSVATSASSSSGGFPRPAAVGRTPPSPLGNAADVPSKTSPPKRAPLPPIPFQENTPQAKIERQKRAPARKAILDQDGIKTEDKAKILGIDKGKRPDPETYMSDAFIKANREEFMDGASRIISTQQLNDWGPAHTDGTSFVFPAKEFANMLKEAGGDRGKLEAMLGMPPGQLGLGSLSRVDIKDPASLNIRVPSGNEAGANTQWLPGAKLPTGRL